MKIAAAMALAELAELEVPDEVTKAYLGRRLSFGKTILSRLHLIRALSQQCL